MSATTIACNNTIPRLNDIQGKLVLADGTTFQGKCFGAKKAVSGRLVFNTCCAGFPELITDPSLKGLIVVFTYPSVGGYGVPKTQLRDELELLKYYQSEHIQVDGVICEDYSDTYSNFEAEKSLGEWLKENNVPGLYGIDTRMLTKRIRDNGSCAAKIEFDGATIQIVDPDTVDYVSQVSRKDEKVYNKGATPKICVVDLGLDNQTLRYLIQQKCEVTIVPFNYDMKSNASKYDGFVISRGPGNPLLYSPIVEQIRFLIDSNKPILAMGLGYNLLCLAAGGKVIKMPYGNHSCNSTVVDLRTTKCYVIHQDHDYVIDEESLPNDYIPLLMNATDHTNEGFVHVTKPFIGVSFLPDSNHITNNTSYIYDLFFHNVNDHTLPITTVPRNTYDKPKPQKVLLLGSGGLSIGQAGEFDYSGSQAIKALKEESIEVILVNPNIATVQTSKGMASKVYFLPVTKFYVTKIIEKERPDSILISMGGQTALNVGLELYDSGILSKYGIRILGTPAETVRDTEDRELFAKKVAECGEKIIESCSAKSMEEAIAGAEKIGYPVLVRAGFALGGLGSGFAKNREQFVELAKRAFSVSSDVFIDKDLRGWKEIEYEVVRDSHDNCLTICSMENFDALGVHTGDSIVIAPTQSLNNYEAGMLRDAAIKVVRHIGIVGECNIQFALDPYSDKYYIIEVNARLSRSSALASKATGYPLAYVAAKICLGVDLINIKNSITKSTSACFEPSVDYIVCKFPRWDLNKFTKVSNKLGSSMKSVGEVMSIGRKFEEVIQKAIRMINPKRNGFEADGAAKYTKEELEDTLQYPDHMRLYCIAEAFNRGYTVQQIYELTKINEWFLYKLKNIHDNRMLLKGKNLSTLSEETIRSLKCDGFSDIQIASYVNSTPSEVRAKRLSMNIHPYVKQVDTMGGEVKACENYLYMTYNGSEHDITFNDHGVMVLGCGPYSIGSSVEFDWAAVNCIRTLTTAKINTIVVNCNPETVSTDYDESDKLYFEELTLERLLDIYNLESSSGIIVSVGGQIPNNLSKPLYDNGCVIYGTKPEQIDRAEDRSVFSAMCDSLHIDQPSWSALTSTQSALDFAKNVGYPVIVRPSFVLSGAAMSVAHNEMQLTQFLEKAIDFSSNNASVVISKYVQDAREIEFDGVAKNGQIYVYAISEHIENAGVHSGDASVMLPAQKLYVKTVFEVRRIASSIAKDLKITGPFNIQLLATDNEVKVIECNLRASRTFPFISKTFDFNFIDLATKLMVGLPAKLPNFHLKDIQYIGIKVPMFSFTRLIGADPTLSVEMASTGEVACFGETVHHALLKSLIASGFKIPPSGSNILISVGTLKQKIAFLESCRALVKMGYNVYCTKRTYDVYKEHNIDVKYISKPSSDEKPNAKDLISDGKISLVYVDPQKDSEAEITDGYIIRRTTVDFGIPLLTNNKMAVAFVLALQKLNEVGWDKFFGIKSMDEYYDMASVEVDGPSSI